MLKTASKRFALLVVAILISLTWIHSGRTAAACLIERGLDPLDVLQVAIRHNVWIGLDNSSSMRKTVDGDDISSIDPLWPGKDYDHPESKLFKAKAALTQIITSPKMNDADGIPLVNWGFAYSEKQSNSAWEKLPGTIDALVPDACLVEQVEAGPGDILSNGEPGYPGRLLTACLGLDPDRVVPSTCGDPLSKEVILAKLKLSTETTSVPGAGDVDGITNNGGTANATSMDQLAQFIRANNTANLKPGQKNIIIYVSDGAESCECEDNIIRLPGEPVDPFPVLRTRGTDPFFTVAVGAASSKIPFYNAGIKGRHSLQSIDPALDGSKGDIFVIFFAKGTSSQAENAHHWAWSSSGFGWTPRPVCPPGGGLGCARGAIFGNDTQPLVDAIELVLSQIGVPTAQLSLGSSVIGSVKEVIEDYTDNTVVTGADLLASGMADTDVRRLRNKYRNNVLFTTSVDTPGFKGHLKAFNIYEVQADGSRTTDFTEIWDAGPELQTRDLSLDPRKIYYNLSDGTRGQLSQTFGTTSLAPTDLGVAAGFLSGLDPTGDGATTKEHAVEIVEKVIQGWRLVIDPDPLGNGFYKLDGTLNFSQFEADGTPGGNSSRPPSRLPPSC